MASRPAEYWMRQSEMTTYVLGAGASKHAGYPFAKSMGTELFAGCPIQAFFWLEWGRNCTAGASLPAARSRFLETHSDSICTRPSMPVA
jgi:hypothetical protein